jgi:hypothetical protein
MGLQGGTYRSNEEAYGPIPPANQAHNGFVEILSAKPTGAIFRVALADQV